MLQGIRRPSSFLLDSKAEDQGSTAAMTNAPLTGVLSSRVPSPSDPCLGFLLQLGLLASARPREWDVTPLCKWEQLLMSGRVAGRTLGAEKQQVAQSNELRGRSSPGME